MELALVPGADAPAAAALASVGVRTVADLARASDAGSLAAMTGIPLARIEALRSAARDAIVEAFRQAGAGDEAVLAVRDPVALSRKTGIAVADVEWFQAAAREALAGEPAGGARVVLSEGASTARVLTAAGPIESVRIVTARPGEDPQALLGGDGDAVLLREGAPVASAKLAGVVHHEIPIFRDDGERLTRVRVAQVRERAAPQKAPSMLDRLRRKRA